MKFLTKYASPLVVSVLAIGGIAFAATHTSISNLPNVNTGEIIMHQHINTMHDGLKNLDARTNGSLPTNPEDLVDKEYAQAFVTSQFTGDAITGEDTAISADITSDLTAVAAGDIIYAAHTNSINDDIVALDARTNASTPTNAEDLIDKEYLETLIETAYGNYCTNASPVTGTDTALHTSLTSIATVTDGDVVPSNYINSLSTSVSSLDTRTQAEDPTTPEGLVDKEYLEAQIVSAVSACDKKCTGSTPMVSTWVVGDASYGDGDNSITLPLRDGYNYNFTADWGDGTTSEITSFDDADITHVYAAAGTYTVTLTGQAEAWYFANAGDKDKITTVPELGDMCWTNFNSAFRGATNLTTISGGDTSGVTDMAVMFYGANSAVPDTSGWETSRVTNMGLMFNAATSANPDTTNWDTSSVTNMGGMFTTAVSATPDTSNWDTSNVTSMSTMFNGATSANPDTSNWDTSSVTSMQSMFQRATSANPDTSNWDTSSVTSMRSMFFQNTSANPDTSNWDTSSVTSMASMFYGATSVNPNVTNWDTSNVTAMGSLFFQASSATPNVTNWDTSSVTSMSAMFHSAGSANPSVDNWDTGNVTNMKSMFFNASSFTGHNLSGWNVSNVTNHTSFSIGWGSGNTEPNWP